MSRETRYQVFLDQCTELAETMVIKSSMTISTMNSYIQKYYGQSAVNTLDPTTWKYYLNISGQYHDLDTMMTVVSMDTLETINFTKANLAIHTATARAYAYGTRKYRELVTLYPLQERLILGILYPVDMNTAINADDYTILGYPSGLVEENEYTLIEKLQRWLTAYSVRWTNTQYIYSDNLYVAQNLGLMHLYMLGAILTFRLEACKTSEAHSYHVRQYLASHGLTDAQIDQLTLKQSFWLYRNIKYILLNQGKQATLELLIEHIMTERSLPLVEYSMRHLVNKMPDQLLPDITFKAKALNSITSTGGSDYQTLDQLLVKEENIAPGNMIEKEDKEADILESFKTSLSSVVQTKVMECAVIDYSDSSPYSLSDILLNNWLDQASTGLYKTVVNITNPKNGETIPLFTKDAYVFMMYAFFAQYGIVLKTVPELYGSRIPRNPVPTVDTLRSYADKNLVPTSLLTELRNNMPVMKSTISIDAFYNQCEALYNVEQYHRALICKQEHMDARAYVQAAVNALFCEKVYHLYDPSTTYDTWFAAMNLTASDFTATEYGTLYLNIVQQATGAALHTSKSMKDMQAAMIGIMKQLSSYSVQYLSSINASAIRMADTPMVRAGDQQKSSSSAFSMDEIDAGGVSRTNVSVDTGNIDVWMGKTDADLTENLAMESSLVIPSFVSLDENQHEFEYTLDLGPAMASFEEIYPENDFGVIPKPGLADYFNLTVEQQRTIAFDIYQ